MEYDAFDDLSPLIRSAERLDALAETAGLMGDDAGEQRWHELAAACRMRAMRLLDD